jgi:hypothetical protein
MIKDVELKGVIDGMEYIAHVINHRVVCGIIDGVNFSLNEYGKLSIVGRGKFTMKRYNAIKKIEEASL